ncbi:MAG: hypothetical protein ABH814_00750 [bacterium]
MVQNLSFRHDLLKLRLRFLSELNLITLKQTAFINDQIVEIGKMIGSWLKKV